MHFRLLLLRNSCCCNRCGMGWKYVWLRTYHSKLTEHEGLILRCRNSRYCCVSRKRCWKLSLLKYFLTKISSYLLPCPWSTCFPCAVVNMWGNWLPWKGFVMTYNQSGFSTPSLASRLDTFTWICWGFMLGCSAIFPGIKSCPDVVLYSCGKYVGFCNGCCITCTCKTRIKINGAILIEIIEKDISH